MKSKIKKDSSTNTKISMPTTIHEAKHTSKSLIENLKPTPFITTLIILFSIGLRLIVSLGTYSGYNTPPHFGDFEAQRNWLSTTLHVPISQWYYYNLHYWGIDYPPLTCYHSYIQGYIFDKLDPSLVALEASKGLENAKLKLFMRMSVIVVDLMFLFTAWLYTFSKSDSNSKTTATSSLSLLSFTQLQTSHILLGSISFVLALSYKQMALYYALPIFFYILGLILQRRSILLLVKVGITVILTFIVVLLPFLVLDDRLVQLGQILFRLFPLSRGLFEDKVANFWCSLNVVIKLKNLYDPTVLAKISAIITLLVQLPALIKVLLQPTKPNFVLSLAVGGLAFFLFSFQVHEKTILLPLLPILLLTTLNDSRITLQMVRWFTNLATFSMYPLLLRDGIALQYAGSLLIWNCITSQFTMLSEWSSIDFVEGFSYLVPICLHLLQILIPNPVPRYPDIYPTLNAIFSASFFVSTLIFLYYVLFTQSNIVKESKKQN